MSGKGRRLGSVVLFAGALTGLLWLSLQLALGRIYQVDECQNLYMATVLAKGQASEFFTNAALFLLGPLSWVTRCCASSAQAFMWSRLLFLGVFWLNILLMAVIASGRLWSTKGAIGLLAAATLAPLWDYGFEIRHDNVILTGILFTWWAVRTRPMGIASYVIAGAIAISLLFIAVKSVVYVVPLSLAILMFPAPGHKLARWKLLLAWVSGAALATVTIRLCYGTGRNWEIYLAVFRGVSKFSAAGASAVGLRFQPWETLQRLLGQTPLLLALISAACFAVVTEVCKRGSRGLTWDGLLPEALLAAGALLDLFVNPTPYPYNLLHFVPYAFLLAFAYAAGLWQLVQNRRTMWPLAGAVFLCAHLAPFCSSTKRHLAYTNIRQTNLMRLAEVMTDPARDSVYDGIGMVVTRRTIHFQWYLHSLNIQSFLNGPGEKVHDMLAACPAAVLIPSYRTDWLPAQDHQFIGTNYVSLADDFWVLGKQLPVKGGIFEIIHPGRYYIGCLGGPNTVGTSKDDPDGFVHPIIGPALTGTLDGVPIPKEPVELAVGTHTIQSERESGVAVVWVGPNLKDVPRVGAGDHRVLFVNWY
jgi:hypothetical protein